jgi:hypothetical protein
MLGEPLAILKDVEANALVAGPPHITDPVLGVFNPCPPLETQTQRAAIGSA